jgi:hypothetical protein
MLNIFCYFVGVVTFNGFNAFNTFTGIPRGHYVGVISSVLFSGTFLDLPRCHCARVMAGALFSTILFGLSRGCGTGVTDVS